MPSQEPVIVWFERDLRVSDNPALCAAAATGRPVLPLFVLDDGSPGPARPGAASRWWLHHGLAALAAELARLGAPLLLLRGAADAVLDAVVRESGAAAVLWNRRYEPWAVARDRAIKERLNAADGTRARSFAAGLLWEPWTVRTAAGGPFRVFTPFHRACLAMPEPARPEPPPARLVRPARMPAGDRLEAWELTPRRPDWAGGLRESWTPGEAGARTRLEALLDGPITAYGSDRDRPDHAGTSRLSPHLHFGEIGPRQVWHAVRAAVAARPGAEGGAAAFLRELVWREFSHHLLFHAPGLPDRPLRDEFANFPWRDDPDGLAAWQRGRTGFPIVDAGMRELWHTGWMHNRVRMIAASFLVKDLLLPWQAGAAWFLDTLVDADLANNSASWQWVAGCGADAAPFFRVFNPVLQGRKFDPDGAYVRRWVPELAGLPDAAIHAPWEAPPGLLRAAGIDLGETYPRLIVDHAAARRRALAAFATIKGR